MGPLFKRYRNAVLNSGGNGYGAANLDWRNYGSPGNGSLAPAGTPPAIVAKLEKDITEVLKSPAVSQKLIDLGFDPIAGSGAALAAIVDRDLPVWRDVVQKSGAKVE